MKKPIYLALGCILVFLAAFVWIAAELFTSPNDPNVNVASSSSSLDELEPEQLKVLAEIAKRRVSAAPEDEHPSDDYLNGRLDAIRATEYFQVSRAEAERLNIDVIWDMLVKQRGHLTEAQRARYNELHIVPWNPRTGEDCSVPEGGCDVLYEREPRHPYELLSLEQLRSLPEDDPAAPLHIPRKDRFLTLQEVVDLYVRAAALANKPGDLLQYGYWVGNGKNLDALRFKYVTELIAFEMGDERARPSQRRAEIEKLIFSEGSNVKPKEFLAHAEDEAASHLARMDHIRRSVFGLPLSRRNER